MIEVVDKIWDHPDWKVVANDKKADLVVSQRITAERLNSIKVRRMINWSTHQFF